MANLIQIISTCLTIVALTHLVCSDKATIDRIKKHQEWLKHHKSKTFPLSTTNYKLSYKLANLWRFPKATPANQKQSNEVYPTNDVTTESTVHGWNNTKKNSIIDESKLDESWKLSNELPLTNKSIPMTTSTTTSVPITIVELPSDVQQANLTTESPLAKEAEKSPMTTNSPKRSKTKYPFKPRWSNWGDWSECSRTCGGGVKSQSRKCISRSALTGKRYTSDVCIGVFRRYQICNEKPCQPGSLDFRSQQCAVYNNIVFQGQRYDWEPYIKDDAECELNCKPMGMKYFATLNDTVTDGTPCSWPAEYYRYNYTSRAVCADGICKAVHNDGSIYGLHANSGSVSCGGLLCRPVAGIFTRDPLPTDAYVHVAFIPAGASNISITELKNSPNLLVLRTSEQNYIFNGENTVSESSAYEAVGSIFDYHRIDSNGQHGEGVTEWIISTGPIRDSIELMVYSKTLNPGIKYEYLLPIVSDSEENEMSLESSDGFLKSGNEEGRSVSSSHSGRRRRFNWKVVGFSSCTRSCGGGTQTPIIRCTRENPVRYYSQRRCMHSEKPVLNENLLRCNTQPCPAYWRLDEWGECRCQRGESFRHREVSCVQELASSIVIHVDNSACLEEQPPSQKQCECVRKTRYRMHGLSNSHEGRSKSDKNSSSAVWLMSDWNQYCSLECGAGAEYRTIFCDRTKIGSDRCNSQYTPDIKRPCEKQRECLVGDWFAGPWSRCNGNCFNLTRSRTVFCIHNQLITDDDDCKADLKPQLYEKCSHDEVEYCSPRWHYSEWSECTVSCGGGTQRRSIKCLEYDERQNSLRESTKCMYSLREPILRGCNTQKCAELKYELLQDDAASTCADNFPNCKWAVHAKLCSYDYYRTNCCYSCRSGL